MMRCKLPLIFAALIFLQTPVGAIDLQSSQIELGIQNIRNSGHDIIENYAADGDMDDLDFDIGFEDDAIYEFDYKSPKRAFVYSLLIPGWGQKYANSATWKVLAFIGIEAGMWMGYFKYRKDGNVATDDYEDFADDHWNAGNRDDPLSDTLSYYYWADTIFTQYIEGDRRLDEIRKFSESLPDRHNQQYYEMIGKYDQFRGGWDDYWIEPGPDRYEILDNTDCCDTCLCPVMYVSPNRQTYNVMRANANDLLDKANTFIVFAVVNHLLSAFDAALAANRYNRRKASEMWLSFRTEMKPYSATQDMPIIKATLRF